MDADELITQVLDKEDPTELELELAERLMLMQDELEDAEQEG